MGLASRAALLFAPCERMSSRTELLGTGATRPPVPNTWTHLPDTGYLGTAHQLQALVFHYSVDVKYSRL